MMEKQVSKGSIVIIEELGIRNKVIQIHSLRLSLKELSHYYLHDFLKKN